MGVFTRIARLCRADMHGVLDELEDRGLLLKEALREMEAELARKGARLEKLGGARDQARQDYERHVGECDRTEQDLAMAIEKDRDDLARFLIRKLKPMEQVRDALSHQVANLEQEIDGLREIMDEQRRGYEALKHEARTFLQREEREHWERKPSEIGCYGPSPEPSDEEVELELMRRKEARAGGETR